MSVKVGILGGGAAGIFAGVNLSRKSGVAVEVLEKTSQLLGKVRVSGGGRCNLTHNQFDPEIFAQNYPRGSRELKYAFSEFGARETVEWFRSAGLLVKSEPDGRMFPVSDSSLSVIDCLLGEGKKNGLKIFTNQELCGIERISDGKIRVLYLDGTNRIYDSLLVATGSSRKVWKWLEALGHRIVDPVPSLFSFRISDPRLEGNSGLTFPQAILELAEKKLSATGGLLITHWGLSGPAVLRLSAWGARYLNERDYQSKLRIHFMPGHKTEDIRSRLQAWRSINARKTLASQPEFLPFPNRYWSNLLNYRGWSSDGSWANVLGIDLQWLAEETSRAEFSIQGKGEFKDEFVTAGGVNRKDVNFSTMESRIVPNLYFAGEVLDVDGVTGGFNFQNAWTTAWLAVRSILKSLG